jgi:hypothetical protein
MKMGFLLCYFLVYTTRLRKRQQGLKEMISEMEVV